MARLALGVVGAVAGGLVGGPQGAQWGWMIGSMIGGVVDPQVIRNQGPRLSDMKVQVSSWGVSIPRYYGAPRGAGNVIWSTPLRETATTTRESAKGGPKVENTTYSYDVNLAVGLGEGEITGIRRIWANGRLIYDVSDGASTETIAASQAMARSFTVYTGSQTQLPDPTIEADKGAGNVSAYRGLAYVVFENFQLADYGNQIPQFEFEIVKSGVLVDYRRLAYEAAVFDNLPSRGPFDLSLDGTFTFAFGSTRYRTDYDAALLTTETASTARDYGYVGRLGDVDVAYIGTGGTAGIGLGYLKVGVVNLIYKSAGSSDEFCGACVSADGARLYVIRYTSPNYYLDTYDADLNLLTSAVQTIITPGITSTGSPWIPGDIGNFAVESDHRHMWVAASIAGSLSVYAIEDDGSLTGLHTFNADGVGMVSFCGLAADNGICLMASYHGQVGAWTRLTGFSGEASPTVGDIVTAECAVAGLSAVDIDVTDLTDSVVSYAITRQSSTRQILEQLQKAYFFDAVESDSKLVFVKRGGAVAVTIPYDDLAAHEPGQQVPDPLQIRRLQEVELPQLVAVNYLNSTGDMQVGNEKASRQVIASSQQITVDLAIGMTPDKAAQIAEVLLFDAYATRNPVKFSTTRKYARYQPTDVMVVPSQSASYRLRIVKKDEAGPLINWEAVTDDATIYTSSAEGGASGQSQTSIATPGPTKAAFLDIPILRDTDDDAGLYVAMCGYKPEWRGAVLLRSEDGSDYADVASVRNAATIGACATALGDWGGGNFFDETNSLDVTLISGSLSSASHDQVLNGANVAVVGNEIIQFKTATLIGANQYRLNGFLRGRRGTEQHQSGHAIGDRFVLMTVAGVARPTEGTSAIGAARYFKPVSFGRSTVQTSAESVTNNAVGLKPLAPVHLAGGKLANGDFSIAWTRRTRVDGGWRNFVDASLGESAESYEIDIMSGATVKRTLSSFGQSATYTDAQQIADFGASQNTVAVQIYQVSAAVGRGFALSGTLFAAGNDPYAGSTVLLMHMDGANGSTAFSDEKGKVVAALGNAQISTAQSKFGGASAKFDGVGDYLTIPDSDDWNLGAGDFTIEGQFNFDAASLDGSLGSSVTSMLGRCNLSTGAGDWAVLYQCSTSAQPNNLSLIYTTNGATLTSVRAPWVPTPGTFHHVAMCRSGQDLRMFVDGVQVGITHNIGTTAIWSGSTASMRLGADTANSRFYKGYMDEVRITKGVARYTATFTPPASAFTNF